MFMFKYFHIVFYFLFITMAFVACTSSDEDIASFSGLKPIYIDASELDNIYFGEPIASEKLGKIYYKAPYIFIGEARKGIHVLDNSNPNNPIKLGFIHLIASEDIAIKGNTLYAGNGKDLAVIDISDIQNLSLVKKLKDIYDKDRSYPSFYSGFFECVDPDLGVVIDWEMAELLDPKCRR